MAEVLKLPDQVAGLAQWVEMLLMPVRAEFLIRPLGSIGTGISGSR